MKHALQILKSHIKTPHLIPKNVWWRISKSKSDIDIIFVVGVPRSGTTLLQKILESHSKLFSVQNETAVFSKQNYFLDTYNPFCLPLSVKKDIISNSKNNIDFFSKSVQHLLKSPDNQNKKFVEKTPQHILRLKRLIEHFPNAKFVHIVRDGRDAYCSARKHKGVVQGNNLNTFANYYKDCLSTALKYENALITLKYEDLASNSYGTVQNLMSDLGLDFEESQLSHINRSQDKRAQREVFKKLNEKINTKSIARYKSELSSKEIQTFNSITNEYLAHYGYELD